MVFFSNPFLAKFFDTRVESEIVVYNKYGGIGGCVASLSFSVKRVTYLTRKVWVVQSPNTLSLKINTRWRNSDLGQLEPLTGALLSQTVTYKTNRLTNQTKFFKLNQIFQPNPNRTKTRIRECFNFFYFLPRLLWPQKTIVGKRFL